MVELHLSICSVKNMRGYLKGKLIFSVFLIGLLVVNISCDSKEKQEGFEAYLWDFKDCVNCTPKQIFIENNELYSFDKGILESRLLHENELDNLRRIIANIDVNKIDSTYYRHLANYQYTVDFSIANLKESFSTSVYDSVFPLELSEPRNYILEIAKRDGLREVTQGKREVASIWIHRLINGKKDTILPSRESIFKIQKVLKATDIKDWYESDSIKDISYQILFEDFGEIKSGLEHLGITSDNKLFFKLVGEKKYHLTNFIYSIRCFPRHNPPL